MRFKLPAIEKVIRGLSSTDLADARAWSYQQGGHIFYCVNFPNHNSTWCFDTSTGLWHERGYLNLWSLERHRADCHTVAFGLNVVGDYDNGKIYELDPDTITDAGTYIKRLRTAPHFSKNLKRLFHKSLQIDLEAGVGLSSGQGSDPQLMIRWSDDGGHTWSNERYVDMGAIGEYRKRAIFRRLGSSRDRVYEVSVSDPVKVVFLGAELDVEEGAS